MRGRPQFVLLASFLLPLLLAAGLGMWRLEVESIWHDEAWSIRALRSPFGTPDDNTPFLYYFLQHLLHRLGVGETPFALRYGSVLLQLPVLALAIRIGWRWYRPLAGLVAGLLMALSPLLWEYAQEIRAYVAVPFFTLALLAGAEALLRPRQRIPAWHWGLLLLAELAALYTHNLAVVLVAWLNMVMILGLGWRVFFRPDRGLYRRRLLSWLLAQGGLLLLYVPWLLTQSQSGTALNTIPRYSFDLLQRIWQGYLLPVPGASPPQELALLSALLGLLALAAAGLLLWRQRELKSWLLLSQVLLLPLFGTMLLRAAHIDFHPRYFVMGVPALMLLFAAVLGQKKGQAAPLPGLGSLLAGLALLTMGLISARSLHLTATTPGYQHDDFRGLAAYYASLPADSLLLIPYGDEPSFSVYYAEKLGIQAQLLNIPLHSTLDDAISRINAELRENETRHVELLTWFQLPADVRGMYHCLLQAASSQPARVTEVYGLRSEGFSLTGPLSLQPLESANAQVQAPLQWTGARYLAGEQALCLASTWRLSAPSPSQERYQVAASIQTALDWALSSDDGPLLRDDQAEVGAWALGDLGQAFHLLPLPAGLPAGDYASTLRLYTAAQPSGFEVISLEDGRSLGRDLPLPPLALAATPYHNPAPAPLLRRDNAAEDGSLSQPTLQVELDLPSAPEQPLLLQGENLTLHENLAPRAGIHWLRLPLPADASGPVELRLGETRIARYTIQQVARSFERPTVQFEVEADFPGVGTLVGIRLDSPEVQAAQPFQVELVWQAQDSPNVDYRVFVQLLDPAGRVLAQSDHQPANGERPTSGWLTGEYLLDSPLLTWNSVEYRGEAQLIVGLYDPATMQRIQRGDGSDAVLLPVTIVVR